MREYPLKQGTHVIED